MAHVRWCSPRSLATGSHNLFSSTRHSSMIVAGGFHPRSLPKMYPSNVLQPQNEQLVFLGQRYYSQRGFFGQLVENIRQEFNKNKEMKESLKKFREEAEKLEQSDALQQARKKFQTIESETSRGSEALRKTFEGFKGKLNETIEDVQKTDFGKRAGEISERIAQQAKGAAESVAKQSEQLGTADAMKKISRGVKTVTKELEQNNLSRPYKSPVKLRKRAEFSSMPAAEEDKRIFEPNEDATGVQLHKDSKWFESWEQFKNNNAYVNKLFEFKMKYDESEHPVLRASRAVTDKISDIMGGLFSKTELSEVLTEILKIDPTFDKELFLRQCHEEIIPNLLEAMMRGDLEVLRDWCHDGPFNILSTPIKQAATLGYHFDSKVLDISNVDLAAAKMMEQGPVLVITFQSQAIMCVRDKAGVVVEGDASKVMRTTYVWVLCRDQTVLDPRTSWKLIDLSANSVEQWL